MKTESLLITTGYDKKVKIWHTKDGCFVDSFQQNYDKKEPSPVAFKRINTDEFYDFSFIHRVDQMYTMTQKILASVQHPQDEDDKVITLDADLMDGIKDL